MFEKDHTPQSFDDLVFSTLEVRDRLESYASLVTNGSILLHGPYGTGKSTVARIIAQQWIGEGSMFDEVRPPIFNGGDFHADCLLNVERIWNLSTKFSYAVIDEFDRVNNSDQAKVRALMDRYTGENGFIFTTNYLGSVDPALQSRCDVIEMPHLPDVVLVALGQEMLSAEGVKLEVEYIKRIVEAQDGSIRGVEREICRLVAKHRSQNAA